jgi:hypothetical protein
VGIAIAGDLIEFDLGIFFRHSGTVIVIIPQVEHGIRPDRIDTAAHKTQACMGIG